MSVTAIRRAKRPPSKVDPAFHPFPIRNEPDYRRAFERIEPLAVKTRLSRSERDFLDVMTILIDRYEEEHHRVETAGISGIEVLKNLLRENGMTGSDLGRILGTRTQGYPILRGERSLSKNQMLKLGNYFGVTPGLFLGD